MNEYPGKINKYVKNLWHVLWQRRLGISHLSTKNQLPQLSQPCNKVPPKRHWLHARDMERVLKELREEKEVLSLGV